MSKFGFDENVSIHDKIYAKTEKHDHVPGRAYTVENPSEKLVHMIGGGFFNEPRYYDSSRSYEDFRKELASQGKITSRVLDKMGLTEQARSVIQAMQEVAESENPEDLLVIAAWARDKHRGLKLRTTPQIALVIAAANEKTKPFVRRYATSIMTRVDEIRQVFAAFRHIFQKDKDLHKGSFPHSLRKAIGEVLAKASIYELLKYNSSEHPTMKDVLMMVTGSKKMPKRQGEANWPLPKAVFEYLVNNKITEDAPDMIKARDLFFKLGSVKEVSGELIEKAGLTWENITSKFGSSKEVWELCIPIMGEMALTRNLRNFEQAGISREAWDKVYEKCGNIVDTCQLPFRFFSALKQTSSTEAKSLVSAQLDKSCENVPVLSGITVVLVDNSGSAQGAVVSGKSDLRVADAGNTLAAIVAKKHGRNALVGVFGDSLMWVPFVQNDSCLSIKEKIDYYAGMQDRGEAHALAIPQYRTGKGVGGGTETGLWWGIHDLTTRKVKVDRFILLSDLCCYTQGDVNCGVRMSQFFGSDKATIQSMFELYRQQVNPEAYVYSVNLAGYKQSQISNNKRNHLLSGWSEQIFSVIRDVEGIATATQNQQQEEVPTLAVLRSRYKINLPNCSRTCES